MSKRIKPVDRYELRKALITIPGEWVQGKGWYISIEDLNKAIDDMHPLSVDILAKYVVKTAKKASKTPIETPESSSLTEMLSNNDIRSYVGMKPLNGFDEFINKERAIRNLKAIEKGERE